MKVTKMMPMTKLGPRGLVDPDEEAYSIEISKIKTIEEVEPDEGYDNVRHFLILFE